MVGIYSIRNLDNGKIYIGSSIDIRGRFWSHQSSLRRGSHKNSYLQQSWDKYGEAAFEFIVLMTCPEQHLMKLEQLILDSLVPEYNISNCVEAPRRGAKFTDEQLKRLSESHKGIVYGPMSDEHKKKIGDSNRGKVRSNEFRKNVGDTHRGKPKLGLRGERNVQSKLTEDNVREIRRRAQSGENHGNIAKDYPISRAYISRLVTGKSWKWII